MVAFKAYLRNMHPMWSLFTRFDYRFKRLMRMAIVLFQVCIITFLVWFAYSKQTRDWEVFDGLGEYKAYWVSVVLGLLTLPLPKLAYCCCMTDLYVMKQEKKERQKAYVDEDEEEEAEDIANQPTEEPTAPQAALYDQFYILKALCLLFIYATFIGTVIASIVFWQ